MKDNDDPYAVLGVSTSANAADIRSAYRRLAQQHHPDRPGGSAERMAALNRAYAILGDPAARRRFDASREPSPPTPRPEPTPPAEPEPAPWLEDLELGQDMQHWQQMYAEERRVWQELLRGEPASEARQQLERAFEQSRREQLGLENAIRERRGEPVLSLSDLDHENSTAQLQREQAAHSVGCTAMLAVPIALVAARLMTISPRSRNRNPLLRAPRRG